MQAGKGGVNNTMCGAGTGNEQQVAGMHTMQNQLHVINGPKVAKMLHACAGKVGTTVGIKWVKVWQPACLGEVACKPVGMVGGRNGQ